MPRSPSRPCNEPAEVFIAAKWQNIVVNLETFTEECFQQLHVVTSWELVMHRVGYTSFLPAQILATMRSAGNGASESGFLNLEDSP
jgi:hypothetical protein